MCDRSCPYETWSDDEYAGLYISTAVIGCAGLLISLCVVPPKLFDSNERKYPNFISTTVLLISVACCFILVWPVFFGYEDLVCENNVTLSDQSTTECSIYGAALYFCSFLMMYCWLLLILLKVVFESRLYQLRHKKKLLLYWLCFTAGVVIPTTCTIYMLSNDVVVGQHESGFACFVDPDRDDGWWLAGTFFIPMGVMLAMGMAAMVCVYPVSLLVGGVERLVGHPGQTARSCLSLVKSQWRLYLFIAYHVFVWAQILAYYVAVRALKDETDKGRDEWYECLQTTGTSSGCALDHQIPYGVTAYVHMLAATYPVLLVLLFGCTVSGARCYANFFWGLVKFRVIVCSGQVHALKKKRAEVYKRRRLQAGAKERANLAQSVDAGGGSSEYSHTGGVVGATRERMRVARRRTIRTARKELLYGFGAQVRAPKDFVDYDDFPSNEWEEEQRSMLISTNSSSENEMEMDQMGDYQYDDVSSEMDYLQ